MIVLLVVFALAAIVLLAVIAVLLADINDAVYDLVKLEEENLHGRIECLEQRLRGLEGGR